MNNIDLTMLARAAYKAILKSVEENDRALEAKEKASEAAQHAAN